MRYLVICRGPHCRHRGAGTLRARLARVLRGREDLRVAGYACFGLCEHGPNVLLYPEGVWFGGLARPGDAERLVRRADGGRAPELVQLPVFPAEREEHLVNAAEVIRNLDPLTQPSRGRWRWPFSRG